MTLRYRQSIGQGELELLHGDITDQHVDAIVNAANSRLAGGGGVDGAIHRAGGPEIKKETDREYPGGCPTGEAVPSSAGKLPAKFIFHAVGPRWKDGEHREPERLASAYRRCLALAREFYCRSIAFPSISTGIYGFPIDLAAEIALQEALFCLRDHRRPELIRWVLFSESDFQVYRDALASQSD